MIQVQQSVPRIVFSQIHHLNAFCVWGNAGVRSILGTQRLRLRGFVEKMNVLRHGNLGSIRSSVLGGSLNSTLGSILTEALIHKGTVDDGVNSFLCSFGARRLCGHIIVRGIHSARSAHSITA